MSKTFETNALKGKSLGSRHETENRRTREIRRQRSGPYRAAAYRKIIKQNYLQDQWAGFGLQDKR